MSGRDQYQEPEARRPRRPPPGARGARRPRRRPGGGGRGISFDRRLLLIALAAVVLVVVLIFAVRQCQRDQLVNSYKGYVSDATVLIEESTEQGGTTIAALRNPDARPPAQLRQELRQIADAAEQTRARAEELNPPGSLDAAHRSLLVALGYRASGIRRLSDDLQTILQNQDEASAANGLANVIQRFLASDVLYQDSFLAPATAALEEDNITGVSLPEGDDRTRFLPGNTTALASATGASRLLPDLRRTGGGGSGDGGGNNANPDGNLKGVELISVEVLPSGRTLVPGEEIAVTGSSDLRWRVTVENGGDFDETQIPVKATLTFDTSGEEAEVREGAIPEILQGQTGSIELAGPQLPRFESAELSVEVGPVPQETRTDNNSATYRVKFVIG